MSITKLQVVVNYCSNIDHVTESSFNGKLFDTKLFNTDEV